MSVIPTYHNNNTETLQLESIQTEWGPRLNLEYPDLTSSMPFVLFKAVLLDELEDGGTINPAYIPNDDGVLAEQGLNRDSLPIKKDSVANTTKITPQNRNNEIKLYPNPTSGFVNLYIEEWKNNDFHFSISNTMGQVVFDETTVKERVTNINIQSLPKGVYYIAITGKDKSINLQLVVL